MESLELNTIPCVSPVMRTAFAKVKFECINKRRMHKIIASNLYGFSAITLVILSDIL